MNKQHEVHFLNEFLRLSPDLDVTDVIPGESPDFLVKCGGMRVGIELVRFVFPQGAGIPGPATNNYRQGLEKWLTSKHMELGLPAATVHVQLNRELLLTPESRTAIGTSLIAFVAGNMPAVGPHVSYRNDDLTPELYEKGVSSVSILRSPAVTKAFWALPHAEFVPDSTGRVLQGLIDKKSPLTEAYRTKAEQLWLLVIAGTEGLQSMLDLDGDVLTAEYRTPFDRVFLYRTAGTVHELTVGGHIN